jgi:hypothetical protein
LIGGQPDDEFALATAFPRTMLTTMKTTTLTARERGPDLRQERPVTCAEAAEILRRADLMLNPKDRKQIAAAIEEARRRMKNEHLH